MNLPATIARAGPWIAPVTPAYLIYRSLITHLNTPSPIAIAAGITIEVVGITISHNVLRAYAWNREKRKIDPAAPISLTIVFAVAYLLIGILLTTVLEIFPQLAPGAASIFFLLAAIAYVNLAIHADQDRRVTGVTVAKAEAKAERKERRKATAERSPDEKPTAERSPDLDERLTHVHQTTGNRPFKRLDVQQTTGLAKTASSDLIKYGVETGQIQTGAHFTYTFENGKEPSNDHRN